MKNPSRLWAPSRREFGAGAFGVAASLALPKGVLAANQNWVAYYGARLRMSAFKPDPLLVLD
jgi:hypothetical protein